MDFWEKQKSSDHTLLTVEFQEWTHPLTAQFLYGWIVILVRKLHLYLPWLHRY